MKKKKKATGRQESLDSALRLTETELLRLGKISAEMRLALLSVRVAVFEAREIKAKAESELRAREAELKAWAQTELEKKEQERAAHLQESHELRKSYDHLTAELAERYGIEDPNSMVVDPYTGVVRDSKNL